MQKQMCPRSLHALRHFRRVYLHAQMAEDTGDVRTWHTIVILIAGNPKDAQFEPMPGWKWCRFWDLHCISVVAELLLEIQWWGEIKQANLLFGIIKFSSWFQRSADCGQSCSSNFFCQILRCQVCLSLIMVKDSRPILYFRCFALLCSCWVMTFPKDG